MFKNKEDVIRILGEVYTDVTDQKAAVEYAMQYLKNSDFVMETRVAIGDVDVGKTIEIGGKNFIVLEHIPNKGTAIISAEFEYENMKFGENSNWLESPIRAKLHDEYYTWISGVVGSSNLTQMQRDLTSMDGLDDYGVCYDTISMLTMDEYRKYHKILGLKPNYDDWWWTITPASTPSNGYAGGVCYVCCGGSLRWCGCGWSSAVRPFCVLNSSVLVLEKP